MNNLLSATVEFKTYPQEEEKMLGINHVYNIEMISDEVIIYQKLHTFSDAKCAITYNKNDIKRIVLEVE